MSTVAELIDLSPALSVALVGGVLSLLPLAWVAWRQRSAAARDPSSGRHWQRALTLVTLFLTLDLVVFGAFTRLTDSGLGCPDWPGCYGSTTPLGAHGDIAQAQAALPHGPVTHTKAWIEMIHRYLATGVGALITALMVMAWWQRARRSSGEPVQASISPWWPTWTFVWVCAQGAFGALTVTLKLYPLIVTAHLLGGLMGVALLTAQVRAMSAAHGGGVTVASTWWSTALPRDLRRASAWVLLLWSAQAALGGWVSTNGAVLACAEFPLCHGQWWPEMDWANGFVLLRGLGLDGQGNAIGLSALTAIHMAHRLGAVVAVVAMVWLARLALRRPDTRREGHVLLALLGWQVASGLSNVVLGWPLAAALAHTLGAALTVAWLTRMVVAPAAAGARDERFT